MKRVRLGLVGKYFVALAIGLVLFLAFVYAGYRAQREAYRELAAASAQSMQAQGQESLERRGAAVAALLADALTNPVYFVDLQAIGVIARSALSQPDIRYVVVFDAQGKILHDGSTDIAAFGLPMSDRFAPEARAATELVTQGDEELVDVTQPMYLGSEKLGGVRIGVSRAANQGEIAAATAKLEARASDEVARGFRAQALPVLGLLLLSGGICWMVMVGLVRPIRTLAQWARSLESGHFDATHESVRRDELGELIRAFGTMSRSIRNHDRDVRRLAYLDTLTGMPNRLMLRETLSRAIVMGQNRGTGLALLFVDLDDFKRINDTLGHDAGDEALAQLSRRLEDALDSMRDPGVTRTESCELIARFGGDEFVALVTGNDVRERARALAEKILDAGREPLSAAGRRVHLNASIGITLFPDDAQDAPQLLKHGDIAMYQAKVYGKNCYRFFTDYMTKVAEDRLVLEHDLRAAMSEGQLELHYQPIVSIDTERVVGAEALLRWRHPTRGMVPSSLFVAIAEDFGLIDELGMFAMRLACRDAVHWPAIDGQQPFVSVNVSVKQLRNPKLVAQIDDVLRTSKLASTSLHVELTESALLDDTPQALGTLADLRKLGVKLWLDDFGTGFSGLSHLRRVAVDGVKIDRSFTQDLLTDRDDLALTSAIIAMAGSLGIAAIAEGVESASQLEILRNLKCDLAQGYWLGYPMSQADLLTTLRSAAALKAYAQS
ncbi:MAG TPA: EAL domain-containing protein [Candidatus Saccharimonadia bacterium]|nr:EAL domain-containing protein [Candidatus Saccharimonadia bacterium]